MNNGTFAYINLQELSLLVYVELAFTVCGGDLEVDEVAIEWWEIDEDRRENKVDIDDAVIQAAIQKRIDEGDADLFDKLDEAAEEAEKDAWEDAQAALYDSWRDAH